MFFSPFIVVTLNIYVFVHISIIKLVEVYLALAITL